MTRRTFIPPALDARFAGLAIVAFLLAASPAALAAPAKPTGQTCKIEEFANCHHANLGGRNLRGANLYGANLASANLARADLERHAAERVHPGEALPQVAGVDGGREHAARPDGENATAARRDAGPPRP
jgi:hypothetical protein